MSTSTNPSVRRPFVRYRGMTVALASMLMLYLVFALYADVAVAHERWILTPEEIQYWNAQPKPKLFTEWSNRNVTILTLFGLFIVGWVRLGFTGARELFPDVVSRLNAYGDHVSLILRLCLAWALLSSAVGLEPRHGVDPLTSPVLLAPDLELRLLDQKWFWLRGAQMILGVAFLFGIWVRFFAFVLIVLGLLGVYLFGEPILAYGGAVIGIGFYLLLQGAGSRYIPLPGLPFMKPVQRWLEAQPRQRAQAIMRFLSGTTVLHLGFFFKVMQPNLLLGILKSYDIPLLSAAPETFTLIMAAVEVTCGILIMAGILLRALSIFFLAAFFFFATLLPESPMGHVLFYGVMLSFLFNGAGHFRSPKPRDKPARLVIVGGGFSAVHAAMRIEKLIGPYTRVELTLIHSDSNMLFYPLVPEVISGTIQPGNVVNPIRRIVPQTRVIHGTVARVDERNKRVLVIRRQGEDLAVPYDQLVLAPFLSPNLNAIPGMLAHANTIDSIGDALHIRKRALDRVEQAEFTADPAERQRLLTFAVVGSGQRACATAVELCEMLRTAEASYPVLHGRNWRVHLYEDTKVPFSDFEARIQGKRDRSLRKAGVSLCREDEVVAVTSRHLTLASGERRPVGLVVNASFAWPTLQLGEDTLRYPFELNDDLSLVGHPDIWIATVKDQHKTRRFATVPDLVSVGRRAGYNAWAASQGYRLRPLLKLPRRWVKPYNMGRRSLCSLGGFVFGGGLAWLISRMTNLAAVPGLERNLRILLDWTLDGVFRNDIAVLAPDATERLQRAYFGAGDVVFAEGEEGDVAYVVESGRLEVLREGQRVAELGHGDVFGELALLTTVKRPITVRCLTPCELTVLARDDLHALTSGYGPLAQAIRAQAEERLQRYRLVPPASVTMATPASTQTCDASPLAESAA